MMRCLLIGLLVLAGCAIPDSIRQGVQNIKTEATVIAQTTQEAATGTRAEAIVALSGGVQGYIGEPTGALSEATTEALVEAMGEDAAIRSMQQGAWNWLWGFALGIPVVGGVAKGAQTFLRNRRGMLALKDTIAGVSEIKKIAKKGDGSLTWEQLRDVLIVAQSKYPAGKALIDEVIAATKNGTS